MELIALLRQLADELEKRPAPKFDLDDPAVREALETLFNTWYEKAYSDVEEKLDSLESSVSEHEDQFNDLPSNLGDHDFDDMDSRIGDLESKLKDIDVDEVENAAELARKLEDVDVKALSRLDLGEIGEMMSFFRTLKAHFVPTAERDAA